MSYKVSIKALNTEQAKKIEQKLKENDGYCPCKLIKNDNTKCMCKEFRETIRDMKYDNDPNATATCHCGLYVASVDGILAE